MTSDSKKICLIAVNYFPEVTGCAPYTTDLAENLVKLGHDVTVITALPHYPQWSIPPEYKTKERRNEVLNDVQVLRCKIFVPAKMSALARVAFEASFLFSAWWRSRSQRPDIVIAVSPALADVVVGAALAKRRKVPFGVLVQDLMTAATTQSNISGGDKVAGLASAIESKYLQRADSVAAITESFSDSIIGLGVNSDDVVVSPNYSVKNIVKIPREQARAQLGWPTDTFVLTHTGNMGLKQDLGNLIEAIRLVDSDQVRLLLVGDGSQRAELEQMAGADPKIEFMGLVDESDYSALLSASDVLLLNEAPTIFDMSLPSKLTAYEASGQPILGAVVPGGNTSKVLAKLAQAKQVPAGEPRALAEEITALLGQGTQLKSEKSEQTTLSDAGELRAQRINWVLNFFKK
ncbi:MAG: glycosyltransferase WbuB [Actinobacteria bacterium]|nr:glycosyltransferase WbuB [Actinomycetota bacterium]NBY15199.1 glycosyltransferase WbuB [Actinomycetota bacterium]